MTIYRVFVESDSKGNMKYDNLIFPDAVTELERSLNFKGKRQENWEPIELCWSSQNSHLLEKKSSQIKAKANIAYVFADGLNLAVDSKAKDALEPDIGQQVQFLPIKVRETDEPWFYLNATNSIENALSLKDSEFKIRNNGSVGRLTKAVFDESSIPDNSLFIYPQSVNALMVKGDTLKDAFRSNGLIGLELIKFNSSQ